MKQPLPGLVSGVRSSSPERSGDVPHPAGPRPAQVISLEEFYQEESENSDGFIGDSWTYDCRCGGKYVITERMMEAENHLVGCNSCSEAVWVGYEVADEDDE